jgi:hypothetical protein
VLAVVIGDNWGEFSGYGSRGLYIELRGRPPVFNTRTRRWTAQLQTTRDLIALAESRGWHVTVTGAQAVDVAAAAGDEPKPAAAPPPEPEGLW